jgi:diguanylate cyclase (GGDEF)-like protein
MLWKGKNVENETESVVQVEDVEAADVVTDTVAAFLRAFGQYAFDLDEVDASTTRERCEQWARHVLVGTRRPGEEGDAVSVAAKQRDWVGARQFVAHHRRQENAYVTHTLKAMRKIVWSFVHNLGHALMEERASDRGVMEQLNRLKVAIESPSVERLKREAMAAVNLIEQSIEVRKQRQRAQMEELGARLKAMRQELEEARREMALDALTRLYNRSAFDEQLARTVDLNLFSGQAACLLMIDIDHFKNINDTFGHPAGDDVLRRVADCCTRVFPRKTDFVARYGGEEFAAIIQDAPLDVGCILGHRLLEAVRALQLKEQEDLRVTVSIGIAELNPDSASASWLERADRALYQAKQTGRDRMVAAAS